MQILLKDDSFTVRYWDWTIPGNRNASFVYDRLGSSSTSGEVTGKLMNDWYIVCALSNGKSDKSGVCNPTTPGNRRVFRCGEAGKCHFSEWPDVENAIRGINDFGNYRISSNPQIVNKYDTLSFSNYLEGFAVDDECEIEKTMTEKRFVLCGKKGKEIRRRLHNLVRTILCRQCLFAHSVLLYV